MTVEILNNMPDNVVLQKNDKYQWEIYMRESYGSQSILIHEMTQNHNESIEIFIKRWLDKKKNNILHNNQYIEYKSKNSIF